MDQYSFDVTTALLPREDELAAAAERARLARERRCSSRAAEPVRRRRLLGLFVATPATH